MIRGWPLDAIALHLEAITFGDIKRLLINVPPGFMKSLMLNVFWPAWEWGPMNMPYLRHLAFAYAQDLTTRDNNKLVKLVTSPQYRALWGDRFTMVKIGEHRPENDQTGFVLATSVTGVGTGERGDRSITGTARRWRPGVKSDKIGEGQSASKPEFAPLSSSRPRICR
jgi:hypothetical protein